MKPEYEQAIAALARAQNRDPDELLGEMLQNQLQGGAPPPAQTPAPAQVVRRGGPETQPNGADTVDAPPAQIVRRPPPGPVQNPRHAGVPQPHSPEQAEAFARWLEQENGPDGVFGDGGMTGGGIFGGEAVATQGYDPYAEQRAQQAHAAQALARMAQQPPPQPAQAYPYPQPYPPAPPPQQPVVRMVQQTVYYEGPAGQMPPPAPAPAPPRQMPAPPPPSGLPWPWR